MDVYKCRFFPSGLVVLSAGMDMSVRVWSVETGSCPRTFRGHTKGKQQPAKLTLSAIMNILFTAVSDLAIVGVGRQVLSCSHDGTVIKWLCADGSIQEHWKPRAGPCNAITLSAGTTLE